MIVSDFQMLKINKVLVVGEFNPDPKIYTYASSFCRGFKKLGYEVFNFNCKENFLKFGGPMHYYLPGLAQKINNKLVNFKFLAKVKEINPDLFFMIKSENISYEIIKKLKSSLKTLLVNFYPDNPFVLLNGNSNSNVLNSLSFYDCFLIWSHILKPALLSAGCKNVYYFPFAYEQELFPEKIKITEYEKKKFASDACFIGTWDLDRENQLTKLCNKMPDLNLAIWGNLWEENLARDSILKKYLKGKAIYGLEVQKAFRCSKIVLNFIRRQNMTSHNMRTMEVLASKAFLLTEKTKEQAEILFKEGESLECFSDIDQLCKKINFYLMDDNLRMQIIEMGAKKVKEFEIENQLKKFLFYIKEKRSE